MNSDSIVAVDMTVADYEDLLHLLFTCADLLSGNPEFVHTAASLYYFHALVKSNRR